MKKAITCFSILAVLSCSTFAGQHNKHRVSVKQISHQLNQQFPFTLDFKGIKAAFAEPKLILDVLEQNVSVEVSMLTQSDGSWVKVPCKLTGQIVFDPVDKHLVLDNLLFDDPTNAHQLFGDSAPLISAIKRTIVNHLPDLTLVDFTLSNTPFSTASTRGLLIQSRHVQLSY
ncbi:hypothetical protein [Paraglaciecola polaris]|uniref:DUF1439 domain-containing protein n=1 Tax=Paraglaciecola polaris LMG 21857 TaxID=1129793 RepID=K6Z9Q0_9ALTE|nr:hypothetical protein [Paraglaciecola polaris]GAC32841.1 hypothetical protein GPLA_1934 [Paraglaciecola polaris LMG 21857]|tara:strand:+ start:1584 stop:2099 length:516 start_codon:yes stop_codon:yes gene_type:complete